MYYVGGDTFIHSTGNSYRYVSVQEFDEPNGSIEFMPLKALTESGYYLRAVEDGDGGVGDDSPDSEDEDNTIPYAPPLQDRYLYSGNKVSFAVIRLLNDTRTQTITEQAERRLDARDISLEAYSSVNPKHTVRQGQSIEYAIDIKNNRHSAYNATVAASVPTGASFNSANHSANVVGNSISWSVSVPAGGTLHLTYEVSVTAASGTVVNGSMAVDGLKLNTISHAISTPLSSAQQQALTDSVNQYASVLTTANYASSGTGNNYRIPPETFGSATIGVTGFIRAAYYNAFGVDIRLLSTTYPFYSLVNNDGAAYTDWLYKDTTAGLSPDLLTIRSMHVKSLYGGRELTTYSSSNIVTARSERTRSLRENMLMTGDIIAYDYSSNYTKIIYVYVKDSDGTSKLVRFSSSGVTIKTGSDKDDVFKNILAKKHFVVLRPSQAFNFPE